jgi:hypothetical protein
MAGPARPPGQLTRRARCESVSPQLRRRQAPKGSTGPGSADDPDAHRGAGAAHWPLLDVQNQTPPHSIPVVRCSLFR